MKKSRSHRLKVIITADDFGLSPGVNDAVIQAYSRGILTHASCMVNMPYFHAGLKNAYPSCKGLALGLHINITTGKRISMAENTLTDAHGFFSFGFLKLALLPLFVNKKRLYEDTSREIEAQIRACQESGFLPAHLDSHRHIHMIPWIFRIVVQLADLYKIKRIRVVNEAFFGSLPLSLTAASLFNGGMVKYAILKAMYYCNGVKSSIRFYSILASCRLNSAAVQRIITREQNDIEIMMHPSNRKKDEPVIQKGVVDYEKKHLTSKNRDNEFRALCNYDASR